jgi:hypothetical protein
MRVSGLAARSLASSPSESEAKKSEETESGNRALFLHLGRLGARKVKEVGSLNLDM